MAMVKSEYRPKTSAEIVETCCFTLVCVSDLVGELTMQKVKVMRYVSGRRPDYAPEDSESESSDEEEG